MAKEIKPIAFVLEGKSLLDNQTPKAIKTKIKKIIKTENKNLYFNDTDLTSPDVYCCKQK